MTVKLSGAAPEDDDANGLLTVQQEAIDYPDRPHVVIAVMDTKTLTVDTDSGATVPTMRIKRIEVVPEEHREAAYGMFAAAYADRTGQDELPFNVIKQVREGLGQKVNRETGEVKDIAARRRRKRT